jgi:hypothetical protein
MIFFALINIIMLNIIMGIIVDTFSALRETRQKRELIMQNKCFICDLDKIERNLDRK